VIRAAAKGRINPAAAPGVAGPVGSLHPGRLADVVLWAPALFAVRPGLVLKAGLPAYGASGDGNASTMMAEPVSVQRQFAAIGSAPGRTSLAFLAGSAMGADIPSTRRRVAVAGCREVTAADMVRNTRTGTVAVDGVRREVRLDGEPVTAPPVERLAFSQSYLLG